MEHSPLGLGMSNMPRLVPCPGSRAMQMRYPDPGPTDDSRAGDAAHWVSAECLLSWKSGGGVKKPGDFLDKPDPAGTIITTEIVEGAQFYVGEILKIINKTGSLQRFACEERIDCPSIHPENWGTVDFWCPPGHEPGVAYVRDLKFGYELVEADSWQLINYAVGVADAIQGADVFDIGVIQPRAFHPHGPHRSMRLTRAELDAKRLQLRPAVEESLRSDARLISGEHCYCCRALFSCPASAAATRKAFVFTRQPVPVDRTPAEVGARLRLLRAAKRQVEQALSAEEGHAEELIRSGVPVPGWGFEQGRAGNRVFIEDERSLQLLRAAQAFTRAPLFEEQLCSPAEAERRGLPRHLVNQLTNQQPGKLKLAPVDITKEAEKAFGKAK